ncbi:hypothetical protein JKP88DRAFT_167877 [Tribonema minus]|uniref:HNH nuclease domain-containing protein n=1 Tax=Tribonema minus TaxID=303371 RepID=A0A835YXY4_9STRA|nr:hypothetical protein JKP88DRAFT_167877 [Tribonema minus]
MAYGCTFSLARSALSGGAEVWRAISPDFIRGATGYCASDTGLVQTPCGSVTRGTLGEHKQYRVVNIMHYEYRVHQLVADAFLPQDSMRAQVNHIDGDKLNNAVSNLERVTASENTMHAVRTGLMSCPPGRSVRRTSLCGTTHDNFDSVHAASRSVGKEGGCANIIACCKGRQVTAYGYRWSYLNV